MDPLHVVLLVLLLLALGAVVRLAQARARLAAERDRALAERDLAQARRADVESLRNDFQALAGEVLRTSNTEFLKLAGERLSAQEARAVAGMDKKNEAMDRLIEPLKQAVEETRQHLQRAEKERAGLRTQVEDMGKSQRELRTETGRLVQALRKPNVRGRYGEIQLERVVELAGMRSYCDFSTQASMRDGEGNLQRPDMVVRLPNGRVVAVDAKTPLDAYMDAVDAPTAEERELRLDRYAENFLTQIRGLGSKQYWEQFPDSPELVVMFLPGDQLVDAALERRSDLLELAAQQNVVIASPSTLIGLLRAIHVGWRERSLSENAQELFDLGRELHGRARMVIERVSKVGDSIESARKHYNSLVGSVQSRLVPTLRRFEERGARSGKDVLEPHVLEAEVRELAGLETPTGAADARAEEG